MKSVAVAPAKALEQNGGKMHAIPKPITEFTGGVKLYDSHGDTLVPAKTMLMARLDAKASEKVEISRGTVWLIGTVIAFAAVALVALGLFIGWVREDQANREKNAQLQIVLDQMKVDQMRIEKNQEKLDAKFDKIAEGLQVQAIKDAETKGKAMGYDVGRTDSKAGH